MAVFAEPLIRQLALHITEWFFGHQGKIGVVVCAHRVPWVDEKKSEFVHHSSFIIHRFRQTPS